MFLPRISVGLMSPLGELNSSWNSGSRPSSSWPDMRRATSTSRPSGVSAISTLAMATPRGLAEVVGEIAVCHGELHRLHRPPFHHALQELLADFRQHGVGEDGIDH